VSIQTPPTTQDSADRKAAPGSKRELYVVFWIFPTFFAIFTLIFVVLAKVMPPPRPDITAAQKAQWFAQHHVTIQIGFITACLVFSGAAIANGYVAYQMKRMTSGSTWAYVYMGGMAAGTLPGLLLVAVLFLAATFRGRPTRILALLYDIGILSYNGLLGCYIAAYLAFAVAILYDKNGIFPKWLAYMSIWQIVTEFISIGYWISRAGAFAWNGSIALWLALFVFGTWLTCQGIFLKVATDRQPAGSRPTD
jgi:hypothetical protein